MDFRHSLLHAVSLLARNLLTLSDRACIKATVLTLISDFRLTVGHAAPEDLLSFLIVNSAILQNTAFKIVSLQIVKTA